MALLCAFTPIGRAEDKPASFGFTVEVDASGLFNPVVKSITITAVAPNMPAAKAGIVAKDQVVEVEGKIVAGSNAKDLQPLLKKQVGEPLRLRLRHSNGDEYAATLVGAASADPH